EKPGATTSWLGASIKNIETPGEQSASGLPDKNGVLILRVARGSLPDKSGLQAGDVIRSLEQKPIANTGEMLRVLQLSSWKDKIPATIIRNQQEKKLIIFLK
ncbi:MAG: PDZ domain-containing protein, partial [Bacteroidota bacterium]|nr:PDZ domain-containing protein [Bacteroidota bacterium]